MSDECIRIEATRNGFEIYVKDPAIEDANMTNTDKPWKDPWVEFSFEKPKQVATFVEEVLPKMKPAEQSTEFDAAFKRAVREDED
jgi:hypothetical protein